MGPVTTSPDATGEVARELATTPPTTSVAAWLADYAPEGDMTVIHTAACDRVSRGDSCMGGCVVIGYGLPVYRLDDRCATCGKVRFAHVPDPPDGYWPECATFTEAAVIDAAHLRRQRAWSQKTFGPGTRLGGILAHIRKELKEIEGSPGDVEEWVDVIILAFDGAWRAGWEPQQIIDAIRGKQAKNEARTWPDWREYDQDEAIEHVEPTTVFPPGKSGGAA